MPTVLFVQGWRFFFYSNQGNEPMHIHAIKGDAECRYCLYPELFDIAEEFEYNCSPRLRREVRQIIFEHFDEISAAWQEYFGDHGEWDKADPREGDQRNARSVGFDYRDRTCFDPMGEMLGTTSSCLFLRAKPRRTFAFRLWNSLAVA
jgi:Domain of unknown function (DUF4160)